MKKNIISILLSVILVIQSLSVNSYAFAASYDVTETTDGQDVTITVVDNEMDMSGGVSIPGTPMNLVWEEGSYATATWDNSEGANYYLVNVFVDNNGARIGSTQTGTGGTKIDLQQEINYLVGEHDFDAVDVSFSVIPQVIQHDGTIITGDESVISTAKRYRLAGLEKLHAPTGISLSLSGKKLDASWNRVENAECYTGEYKIINIETGISYTGYVPLNIAEEYPEVITDDIYDYMAYQCNNYGLAGKTVTICIRIAADVFGNTTKLYRQSDFTDWSNSVTYSVVEIENHKLATPIIKGYDTNTLDLNATCEAVADYCEYYINILIGDNLYTTSFPVNQSNDYACIGNGRIEVNYETLLYSFLAQKGISDTDCRISLGVDTSVFTDTGYSSYEKSDIAWTEYFDYHVGQLNKLEKATNIKWKKEGENYTVVFDRDKRSDAIESLEMKIRSNGIERIINPGGYGYGPSEDGVTIGVIDIASAYTYSNEQPEPVYFSVRFKIATSAVNQYQLITSDYSDWSEELLYNPFNKKMVESIELWPQTPYILVGNNLNIGKTIAPTDAWYSKVNWSSADPNIASVDVMGKVYGNSAGTTTITGMVQGVSANADVTVYEIKSNIADAASKEVAVDKAAEVIDSIVNNGDASGTDITSVSEARASIETGMNNKDIFDVELSDEVKEEDDYGEILDIIKKQTGYECFGVGYNVEVGIYRRHGKDKYLIGNITDFDGKIKFDLDISSLPKVANGYERNYKLLKVHAGKSELITFSIISATKIETSSDEFSDFVLMYEDVPSSTPTPTLTPTPTPAVTPEKPSIVDGNGADTLVAGQKMDLSEAYIEAVKYAVTDGSNKKAVSVTKKGVVSVKTGKKVYDGDTAVITAYKRGEGKKLVEIGTYTVTVSKREVIAKTVKLNAYGVSYNGLSNIKGEGYVPTKWESSKTDVASVDEKTGMILTGEKAGTATITAYYGEGKDAARYKFRIKVNKPKLNKSKLTMKVKKNGSVKPMTLTIKGTIGDMPVYWKSDNPSVAAVNETGIVTGKANGETDITALMNGHEYKCHVKVKGF